MAIQSYFFNAVESGGVYDRVYNAEDFTSYLDEIVGNGVFPNPSTQLQVRQGTGMQVIVGAGQGWINGHKMVNTADAVLSIDSADVLLDRIDRVVFYVDADDREMGIEVKKGTPASSPSGAALRRDSDRWELCLAEVTVAHGQTSIYGRSIKDMRADTTLCGWVSGLIQQVDTSTLFNQYEDAYAVQLAEMEAWEESATESFDNWFDTLTSALIVNTYIKRYEQEVTSVGGEGILIPLNMSGYSYREDDIIDVYINGLLADSSEYTLSVSSGTASIIMTNYLASGTIIRVLVTKSKIGDPIIGSSFNQLTINDVVQGTTTDSAEGEIES